MTMTAETPAPVPAPKPKRKYQRRPRAALAALAKSETNEFEGLGRDACCDGCNANRCVISGINVCAHPLKGGLQAQQMQDAKAINRLAKAKEYLRRAK